MLKFAPRLVGLAHEIMLSATDLPPPDEYLAVHLRLEADTFGYWPKFDAQVEAYAFWIARRPDKKTIFLACGDEQYELRFAQRFPEHRVVTKWTLAAERPDLLERLHDLAFDELAAIDVEIARDANLVMGIGVSSFAYLLGVDRRVNRTAHFSATLHDELCGSALARLVYAADDSRAVPPDLAGKTKMVRQGSGYHSSWLADLEAQVGDERTRLLPAVLSEYYQSVSFDTFGARSALADPGAGPVTTAEPQDDPKDPSRPPDAPASLALRM
jgi:hypothetical protein